MSKKGILAFHGYSFEEYVEAFGMHPFTDRAVFLRSGITFSLYGRLAIDLFTCEKLLLTKTKVRIKLIRARPNLYMLSNNPNVSLKIDRCLLGQFELLNLIISTCNEIWKENLLNTITWKL